MTKISPNLKDKPSSKLPLVIDSVSYVGIVGGTIASLVTQQAALATLPLSLMFVLQLFNRHRLGSTLSDQIERVDSLSHHNQLHLEKLQLEAHENQTELRGIKGNVERNEQEYLGFQERVNSRLPDNLPEKLEHFERTLDTLKEIIAAGNLDQNSASAEMYFNRGVNQDYLGHFKSAISDFTQAIEMSPSYAWAYFRRGNVKLAIGQKQSALIDLNLAAKYFFEAGDLGNYQQAKDKAASIHSLDSFSDSPKSTSSPSSENARYASVNVLFGE
ncbi:hypothetical protein [Lyngbya confervoides]|uniref:Tetratricopeptide TPR_1 repeat-containing protein n=1 Tax=Lyngbya confervoides BDU141951 TaxID=1574623 RepID=A0ABD4T5K1_9CYAN|nr:hypothetical protein [Lyngbya confervoides]MCM1983825.1 hypothetical protein [Lyngbya confervoides BDU141951]